MSTSETITRTDLTNILNEVLPVPSRASAVYSATKNMTISNTDVDQNTDGASVDLPVGKYVVIGQWNFYTRDSSGITNSAIRMYRSGDNYANNIAQSRTYGAGSNWNSLQCATVVELTQPETIKICGGTSKAYTTSAATWIKAVRIDAVPVGDLQTDYIVEQGTSGNWTYRKWNGGRMEAEADVTTSSSSWTSVVTNIYYNTTILTPPTGMTVTSGYAALKQGSNYIVNAQIQIGTDVTMVLHRTASSSASFNCHVVLSGKWK